MRKILGKIVLLSVLVLSLFWTFPISSIPVLADETIVTVDATTRGDWQGTYGNNAYVIPTPESAYKGSNNSACIAHYEVGLAGAVVRYVVPSGNTAYARILSDGLMVPNSLTERVNVQAASSYDHTYSFIMKDSVERYVTAYVYGSYGIVSQQISIYDTNILTYNGVFISNVPIASVNVDVSDGGKFVTFKVSGNFTIASKIIPDELTGNIMGTVYGQAGIQAVFFDNAKPGPQYFSLNCNLEGEGVVTAPTSILKNRLATVNIVPKFGMYISEVKINESVQEFAEINNKDLTMSFLVSNDTELNIKIVPIPANIKPTVTLLGAMEEEIDGINYLVVYGHLTLPSGQYTLGHYGFIVDGTKCHADFYEYSSGDGFTEDGMFAVALCIDNLREIEVTAFVEYIDFNHRYDILSTTENFTNSTIYDNAPNTIITIIGEVEEPLNLEIAPFAEDANSNGENPPIETIDEGCNGNIVVLLSSFLAVIGFSITKFNY